MKKIEELLKGLGFDFNVFKEGTEVLENGDKGLILNDYNKKEEFFIKLLSQYQIQVQELANKVNGLEKAATNSEELQAKIMELEKDNTKLSKKLDSKNSQVKTLQTQRKTLLEVIQQLSQKSSEKSQKVDVA